MAATIAQPTFGLQPPATNDDTMEISSDFGAVDGDIDIDLDSNGEHMHFEDDDQMIDDVKSNAGSYHDDDVMQDDETTSNPPDREMQDDAPAPPQQEQDEELLDFSDDEDLYANDAPLRLPEQPDVQITESSIKQTVPASLQQPAERQAQVDFAAQDDPIEQVQSDTVLNLLAEGVPVIDNTTQQDQQDQHVQQVQEPQSTTHPSEQDDLAPRTETKTSVESDEFVARSPDQDANHHQDTLEAPSDAGPAITDLDPSQRDEANTNQPDETVVTHADVLAEDSVHIEPAYDTSTALEPAASGSDQAGPPHAALALDTEPAETEEADLPASRARRISSPTVTGMHPTIVHYQGNEIYLFPSRKPTGCEQYLLENENLADTSLGDLFQACRSVLGESLSDDDELVLGMQELDLYISEDSTPAFSTRFSELLDVYIQLHKNDGNHHPDPFVVTLKTQTRFTNRLNLITQAIAEGKGFSDLSFLQLPGFPDEEDFNSDEVFPDEDTFVAQQEEAQHAEHGQDGVPNEQVVEGSVEYNADDDNGASHVSDEAAQPPQEATQGVESTNHQEGEYDQGEDARDEAQDETQYFETYEEVDGNLQPNDRSISHATDTVTQDYGEDDTINFDDDDDEHKGSLPATASTEGNLNNAQSDKSPALDQVTPSIDPAPTVEELDDIPPPPEYADFDQDFDDETYHEEEGYAQLAAANAIANVDEASGVEGENASRAASDTAKAGRDANETDASNASSVTLEVQSTGDEQHHAVESETLDLAEYVDENGAADQDHDPSLDGQVDQAQPQVDEPAEAMSAGNSGKPEYDPDLIDFDDDEDFDNHETTLVGEVVEAESAKGSPSIKRSYSERNEAEEVGADDQALKKVRSS